MSRALRPLLASVGLCLLAGCSSEGRVSEGASPIIGGADDAADSGAVLVLIKKPNFSKPFEWCTGTVVSPHVVVTAAHCVAVNASDVPPGASLSLYTGNAYDYSAGPKPELVFTIKTSTIYPGFTDATAPAKGGDIAVLVTDEALPATPYALYPDALDAKLMGETVRLVGAGANVLPSTMMYSTGTRKTLTLPITKLDAHYVHEEGDAGSSCSGDSGGPTLLNKGGVDYVIGIHAATVGFPECTGANYDTRIDLYASSFVVPAIEAADPGFLKPDAGAPTGAGGGGGAGSSSSTAVSTSAGAGGGAAATPQSGGCSLGASSQGGASLFAVSALAWLLARRRRVRATERRAT